MRRTAVVCCAAAIAGCAQERDCTLDQARMELRVAVPDALRDGRVSSIAVELSMGSQRGWKTYDLHDELTDGTTSLEVILDDAPNESFELTVWIAAYGEESGRGLVLARGGARFSAEPNGCNLFEVALAEEQSLPDGGVGAPREDAGGVGVEEDASLELDASDAGSPVAEPDARAPDQPDAAVPADGGQPVESPCAPADPNTLALYTFDNDVGTTTITDATGAHRGRLAGNGASYVAGQDRCGRALAFPSGSNVSAYGLVPDSQDWDLAVGSVEFWVMLKDQPPRTRQLGVLSRDLNGNGRGRFSVRTSCDGTIVAKLEHGRNGLAYQCSNAPVPVETWARVTVRFGPPGFELLVDGVPQTRTGTIGLLGMGCSQTLVCGTSTTAGIAGNSAPWVIGADARDLVTFTMTGLQDPFEDGVIDHLRIRDVR